VFEPCFTGRILAPPPTKVQSGLSGLSWSRRE
jgi:hypothetical protein